MIVSYMPRKKKIVKPKETIEQMLGRLVLHDGKWAIDINGTLVVFPQETTRREVEQVIRDGYDLATGKSSN